MPGTTLHYRGGGAAPSVSHAERSIEPKPKYNDDDASLILIAAVVIGLGVLAVLGVGIATLVKTTSHADTSCENGPAGLAGAPGRAGPPGRVGPPGADSPVSSSDGVGDGPPCMTCNKVPISPLRVDGGLNTDIRSAKLDAARAAKCEEVIEQYVTSGYMPSAAGVALGLDGELIEKYVGQGPADGSPWQRDTIVRFASQTKLIGSTAFMTLVDDGKIDLVEQMRHYVPEFADTVVIEPSAIEATYTVINDARVVGGSSDITFEVGADHTFVIGDTAGVFTNAVIMPIIIVAGETVHMNDLSFLADMLKEGRDGFNAIASVANRFMAAGAIQAASTIGGVDETSINGVWTVTGTTPTSVTVTIDATFVTSVNPILATFTVVDLNDQSDARQVSGPTLDFAVSPAFLLLVDYYNPIPLEFPMRVFHILSHTSGHSYGLVAGTTGFDARAARIQAIAFGNEGIPSFGADPTTSTPFALPFCIESLVEPANPADWCPMGQYARRLARVPLLFQPGTAWSYGPQLAVLGRLIEMISGQRTRDFVRERIYTPLGMDSHGFYVDDDDPARASKIARFSEVWSRIFVGPPLGCPSPNPHAPCFSVYPVSSSPLISFFFGAIGTDYYRLTSESGNAKGLDLIDGGSFGTLFDYVKFLDAMQRGGVSKSGARIVSEHVARMITQNQIGHFNVSALGSSESIAFAGPLKSRAWGLGVAVSRAEGDGTNTPNGQPGRPQFNGFGWGGAWHSDYMADVDRGVSAQAALGNILLNNISDDDYDPSNTILSCLVGSWK